jgi:hypothetical protein
MSSYYIQNTHIKHMSMFSSAKQNFFTKEHIEYENEIV